jgi:serine/threonine protein kinase
LDVANKVIEHLAGGTVWSLFKKRGPFSERETAVMIMQVLEAVAHMHDKAWASCYGRL